MRVSGDETAAEAALCEHYERYAVPENVPPTPVRPDRSWLLTSDWLSAVSSAEFPLKSDVLVDAAVALAAALAVSDAAAVELVSVGSTVTPLSDCEFAEASRFCRLALAELPDNVERIWLCLLA